MAVRGPVDDPRVAARLRLHLPAAEDLRGDVPDGHRVEGARRFCRGEGRRRAGDGVPSRRPRSSTRRSTESSSRRRLRKGWPRSWGSRTIPTTPLGGAGARRRHVRAWLARSSGRSRSKRSRTPAIAQITVRDRKPQRAALIANTFADTYMEFNLDYKLEGSRAAKAWLGEQEVELTQEAGGLGAGALRVQEGPRPAGRQPRRQAEHVQQILRT